jgi:hypothetical protein
VAYLKCPGCASLQTASHYWVHEAYTHSLSLSDTGAAQRVLSNLAISYSIAKLFNLKNVIDFGGGDGFLCRLLRDYEINCFVKDTYAVPIYAQAFTSPNFASPDMVTAFEVFEHFVDPMLEIDQLFSLNPKVILLSTNLYTNELSDWWYLSPETGQHLFFYSRKALDFIANKYGYDFVVSGGVIVFFRKNMLTLMKRICVRFFLSYRVSRVVLALLSFVPRGGVWHDHAWIQSEFSN